MTENNSNGLKKIGGVTGLVVALGGSGTWIFNKFDDINKTFASRNERISVLEYKIEAMEKYVNSKSEDRYTGKDAARDKSDLLRRIEQLEQRRAK